MLRSTALTIGITFADFVNYKDASLLQLQAIKLIREMSDEQLKGFCMLMNPDYDNK